VNHVELCRSLERDAIAQRRVIDELRAKLGRADELLTRVDKEIGDALACEHDDGNAEQERLLRAVEAYLADVAKDSTPIGGGKGPGALGVIAPPGPDSPCLTCLGAGGFDSMGHPTLSWRRDLAHDRACGACDGSGRAR